MFKTKKLQTKSKQIFSKCFASCTPYTL